MSASSVKFHPLYSRSSSRSHSLIASLLPVVMGVSAVQAQIVGVESDSSNEAAATQIETVTVTGTRIRANENPVNGLTTVITREMIESRADENVIDLLRGQSGVHVAQAGGRGGIASVQLRGCLLYTSPSPRDLSTSRMPSSA